MKNIQKKNLATSIYVYEKRETQKFSLIKGLFQ